MRSILLALLLILSSFLPGAISDAWASSSCTGADACDQGQAFQRCMAAHNFSLGYKDGATSLKACTPVAATQNSAAYFECAVTRNGTWVTDCWLPGTAVGARQFYWITSCLAKEGLPPSLIIFDGAGKSEICANGCTFKSPPTGSPIYDIEGFARSIGEAGGWTPTGGVCANPEPPPTQEPQCITGAGQTFCLKPDGEKCASASNGKTFCWGKGDNGDKTDGNQYGTNSDGGPKTPTQPPKPPDGTDWKPPAGCTIVHERSGNGYAPPRTICTGTSTGNPNPPQCNPSTDPNCRPPNTNGQCDPKTDPNRCQAGTASGGHGCDTPPTCSGDPINCAVLTQVWRNRCSANGNKASGGECTQHGTVAAFSCSGDEILCKSTLTALERKCKANKFDDDLARDAGNGINEGEEPEGVFIETGDTPTFDRGLLNLGGGTLIPPISIMGYSWSVPPEFYSLLAIIRLIVIAACTIFAIKVVFS